MTNNASIGRVLAMMALASAVTLSACSKKDDSQATDTPHNVTLTEAQRQHIRLYTVTPSRQTYHCFGCGVHGNAVGFLMEQQGMGFIDAVRDRAQQAGLAVPEEASQPGERDSRFSATM